jgi:type I restriction enzyme S subunit
MTEEGGLLPSNWTTVTVGEIGEIVTGNTPPKSDSRNYGPYMPFVKPPELMNCVIAAAEDGLSKVGSEIARVLPANSILVSCIGNLGKTALNSVPVAFNQQINAIVPFEGVNPKFVFYQTQSVAFRRQLEELASATTIAIVNKGKFQSITCNLAPQNEQKRVVTKIEELLSELDKGIDSLATAREQIRGYRQSVLKYAFEGKLTENWRTHRYEEMELADARGFQADGAPRVAR